jgi:uncharacterized protein (DUF697 family)
MRGDMTDLTLAQKRHHGLKLIAEFGLSSTLVSSISTPLLEVPKQVVLTASDLTLCWRLYALYYDRELSVDNLLALLRRAGIVTAVGGSVIYTGARATQGVIDEFLNLVLFGRVFSGLVAASYTTALGLAFLYWIDRAWRSDRSAPLPEFLETGE